MKTNFEKFLRKMKGVRFHEPVDVAFKTIMERMSSDYPNYLTNHECMSEEDRKCLPLIMKNISRCLWLLGNHPTMVKLGESFSKNMMESDSSKLSHEHVNIERLKDLFDHSFSLGERTTTVPFYLDFPSWLINLESTEKGSSGSLGAFLFLTKAQEAEGGEVLIGVDILFAKGHNKSLYVDPLVWGDNKFLLNTNFKTLVNSISMANNSVAATFLRYIILSICYISSGHPDVEQKLFKLGNYNSRRARDADVQKNIDTPQLKTFLVSYNWMKPREFHIDETWVKGHFRWQPCGEKLKDVKLIWIDAHKRIYREEKNPKE